MKNIKSFIDPLETAQTLPMKKRGHFSDYNKKSKKLPKFAKSFKTRRAGIKRGELGLVARFGWLGCSSWWW